MLAGVGFFHFVENHWKDPLGSLEKALRRCCDSLDDRLIVLPEAFNVEADHSKGANPTIPAQLALERLGERSEEYGVVFVVGLIETYNSAYLVDTRLREHPWRLLCHKRTPDWGKYLACSVNPANDDNPSYSRGVCVGSLICADANLISGTMEDRLKECPGIAVLCVPARMDANSFQNDTSKGFYWVLANSNPSGCGSFITNRQGRKVEWVGKKDAPASNTLVARSWAELDDGSYSESAR